MRVARAAGLACIAAALVAACAAPAPPDAPAAARRSNVEPPSISLPPRVEAAPSARIALVARTRGGEAMLFRVDWKVEEGNAGGRVEPGRRNADGSYEATYVAPAVGGTFHVIASIHEYPSATATTEVRVAPR